ncbi:LysR family transcriptional regulator [Chelatococcus reniformis]|nr:LysR family transcriptional regulator [Chelatococcus reniformis]
MNADRYGEILVFTRVVACGGLSAAARALSLSPSAVSKRISRLEKRLNVRLLNRSSRSLRLTAEGEAFYAGAARSLDTLDEAENALKSLSNSPRGLLRIFGPPAFGYLQLAPLVPEFLALYPDLRLEFQLHNEIVDPVEAGVDLAIRMGPQRDSSLVARKIGGSRWIICAAPSYLRRHGTPQTPTDLLSHNCMSFSVRTHRVHWSFKENGHTVRVPVRGNAISNQGEMLRQLALNGVGILRISEFVVAADTAAGRLVPVLADYVEKEEEEPIYAVFHHQRHMSPRIRVFLDFVQKKLAEQRRHN